LAATTLTAMPTAVAVAVVVIGMVYAVGSIFLQRKVTNPAKQREIQAKVKILTKEMQEKVKRNEDISAHQKQLMTHMGESMKLQMRSMFLILPLFLVIYYLALPYVFKPYQNTDVVLWSIPLTYTSLFFATALIVGLISSGVILLRDRKLIKAMQQTPAENPQTPHNPNS